MAGRLQLQEELERLLERDSVYFQPPATVALRYPAIVYSRSDIVNNFADNLVYNQYDRYKVITISRDPDDSIVRKISLMPTCRFETYYAKDGLNYNVFEIYY